MKAALEASLLGLFLATLSSCYLGEQASAYLGLRSRAIPLDRALSDPATSPELRSFIERVVRIRTYALTEFGLRRTKNYNSIVMLDTDRLATVVSACAELSFDSYEWNYPVVGKLPYRGYFEPKAAATEAARLKKAGWDVITRPVDAFSTLGWLSDPLFSFMASYSESEMADTIIHEMTHATIWAKGQDQFNEELASFVGDQGSLLYLASVYGPAAPELQKAAADRADAQAFSAWLRGTASELQQVYASSLSDADKRREKADIIARRAADYKNESAKLFRGEAYRDFPMERLNNAYLDLYRLYDGEPELYRQFYEKICGSSMKLFIETVSRIVKAGGDPKEGMRRALSSPSAEGSKS